MFTLFVFVFVFMFMFMTQNSECNVVSSRARGKGITRHTKQWIGQAFCSSIRDAFAGVSSNSKTGGRAAVTFNSLVWHRPQNSVVKLVCPKFFKNKNKDTGWALGLGISGLKRFHLPIGMRQGASAPSSPHAAPVLVISWTQQPGRQPSPPHWAHDAAGQHTCPYPSRSDGKPPNSLHAPGFDSGEGLHPREGVS